MDVRQLYADNLLGKAFQGMYDAGLTGHQTQPVTVQVEGPEVIPECVILTWLATNYHCALDFDREGNPIMGKLGGTIPALGFMDAMHFSDYSSGSQPHDSLKRPARRAIALSESNLTHVHLGIVSSDDSVRGRYHMRSKRIKTGTGSEGEVTVLRTNEGIASYDFMSGVVPPEIASLDEVLADHAHLYLGSLAAEQSVPSAGLYASLFPRKHLPREYYVLHVPVDGTLMQLRGENKDEVSLPAGFLAGFHITYSDKASTVSVRPLIPTERHDVRPLHEMGGILPVNSPIVALGMGSSTGRLHHFF
ncbi:hypothetical protein HYW21_01020 [Candidatus Woesearchaeota archaeon]|nr:hypothetical protein [Candidatus Woesearchaeota archaeon]